MRLSDRHECFFDLHRAGTFLIPNPWDIGTARMMAALGARALATTSAGYAFTQGLPDMGQIRRDEALRHAETIVRATDLPVSADLENGFSDDPETIAETIRLAADAGLSGASIEDTCMAPGHPSYDFELAVERIRAAVDAARGLGRPFVLCARADGVMNGAYDTNEAIRRLQAFETAGADLLYAPHLPGIEDLRRILASVTAPVNALASGAVQGLSMADLAAMGVRRVSIGSMLARRTHAVIGDAMRLMLDEGSFAGLEGAASGSAIDALLRAGGGTEKAE